MTSKGKRESVGVSKYRLILLAAGVLLLALGTHRFGGQPSRWRGTTATGGGGGAAVRGPETAPRVRMTEAYGKLPLSFEANRGQTDGRVQFLSRGSGYTLFLTGNEAVLALQPAKSSSADLSLKSAAFPWSFSQRTADLQNKSALRGSLFPGLFKPPAADFETPGALDRSLLTPHSAPAPSVVRLKIVGANRAVKAIGLDELPGKSNYFIGNDPRKRRTNVPNYAKVKYQNVYSGIDLVYYGNQRQLEYDFVVAPGADPKAIHFALTPSPSPSGRGWPGGPGEGAVQIDANGDLVIKAAGEDEVRFHKPVVYQPTNSAEQDRKVDGRYVLLADNRVAFDVAAYDTTKPLVIDPTLSYSTYLGGSNADPGQGIAVDSSGSAYVAGYTCSPDFPTENPFQPTNTTGGGNRTFGSFCAPEVGNAFVTKLNAAGSALVYSTYLGGNGGAFGYGIAVDSTGNAYVTGLAIENFPTTAGAFQTALGGSPGNCGFNVRCPNVFVTKLNATGSGLLYSTYLGGSGSDRGLAVAADSSGNAYVTGSTCSRDFPTMNPIQARNTSGASPPCTAFVSKLNAAGSALAYSTYLGGSTGVRGVGSSFESGSGIAADSVGNAYVTGTTLSTDFPTTSGAFQTTFQATFDNLQAAFVTKLNAAGSALLYSTYLAGSTGSGSGGGGIAVDSTGNAYAAGGTTSSDFPTTLGAFQATLAGFANGFVSKLNAAGSALVYSTYLGGNTADGATGIAIDTSGNA